MQVTRTFLGQDCARASEDGEHEAELRSGQITNRDRKEDKARDIAISHCHIENVYPKA